MKRFFLRYSRPLYAVPTFELCCFWLPICYVIFIWTIAAIGGPEWGLVR